MGLTAQSYQFISQLGLIREINAETPVGVTSNWLVPANGWHNGQRLPHNVQQDLESQGFDKTTVEGIEYFKVPEESTNLPGLLSHYAQRTGVADLKNAPGGGVNRVPETLEGSHGVTVAPEAVAKYVEETDNLEEARKKATLQEELVSRQVTVSPAREPADGKLEVVTPDEAKPADEEKPAKKASPSKKAE